MSKRFPWQKWVLPNPVEPGVTACLSITIPDSPEYRAAVNGALFALTRAYNWADDPLHFAKDTAARMLDAYDTININTTDCPTPCPGAYAVPDDIHCPQDSSFRDVRIIPLCSSCDDVGQVYFSNCRFNLIANVARIGYSFKRFTDDVDCCTHVCAIHAFSTISASDWLLTWRDCENVDHEFTGAVDFEFLFGAMDNVQYLCLSTGSPFASVMTIDGPAIPL